MMTASEFAKDQVEFLTRRLALYDAISPEQEQDLMLARAYLKMEKETKTAGRILVRALTDIELFGRSKLRQRVRSAIGVLSSGLEK